MATDGIKDSPLAWTLKAYHTTHSKYLLCCEGGRWGITPVLTWQEVSPCLGLGYPLRRDLGPVTGVPPRKNMGPVEVLWDGHGAPLPNPGCGQTHTCENSTFPILRMRAVNIVDNVTTKLFNSDEFVNWFSTFLHVAARYNTWIDPIYSPFTNNSTVYVILTTKAMCYQAFNCLLHNTCHTNYYIKISLFRKPISLQQIIEIINLPSLLWVILPTNLHNKNKPT